MTHPLLHLGNSARVLHGHQPPQTKSTKFPPAEISFHPHGSHQGPQWRVARPSSRPSWLATSSRCGSALSTCPSDSPPRSACAGKSVLPGRGIPGGQTDATTLISARGTAAALAQQASDGIRLSASRAMPKPYRLRFCAAFDPPAGTTHTFIESPPVPSQTSTASDTEISAGGNFYPWGGSTSAGGGRHLARSEAPLGQIRPLLKRPRGFRPSRYALTPNRDRINRGCCSQKRPNEEAKEPKR